MVNGVGVLLGTVSFCSVFDLSKKANKIYLNVFFTILLAFSESDSHGNINIFKRVNFFKSYKISD